MHYTRGKRKVYTYNKSSETTVPRTVIRRLRPVQYTHIQVRGAVFLKPPLIVVILTVTDCHLTLIDITLPSAYSSEPILFSLKATIAALRHPVWISYRLATA